MQITSRIELPLSKSSNKTEYLTLKVYDSGAVFLDHHPIGETLEEALDLLDSTMRELQVMEAARTAGAKKQSQLPLCNCAELTQQAKARGEAIGFGCSRCALAVGTTKGKSLTGLMSSK